MKHSNVLSLKLRLIMFTVLIHFLQNQEVNCDFVSTTDQSAWFCALLLTHYIVVICRVPPKVVH